MGEVESKVIIGMPPLEGAEAGESIEISSGPAVLSEVAAALYKLEYPDSPRESLLAMLRSPEITGRLMQRADAMHVDGGLRIVGPRTEEGDAIGPCDLTYEETKLRVEEVQIMIQVLDALEKMDEHRHQEILDLLGGLHTLLGRRPGTEEVLFMTPDKLRSIIDITSKEKGTEFIRGCRTWHETVESTEYSEHSFDNVEADTLFDESVTADVVGDLFEAYSRDSRLGRSKHLLHDLLWILDMVGPNDMAGYSQEVRKTLFDVVLISQLKEFWRQHKDSYSNLDIFDFIGVFLSKPASRSILSGVRDSGDITLLHKIATIGDRYIAHSGRDLTELPTDHVLELIDVELKDLQRGPLMGTWTEVFNGTVHAQDYFDGIAI